MAKRGLCILLAVLTLFALAAPAFAAEAPAEEPEVTKVASDPETVAEEVTSGTAGSLQWTLDSSGTLTFSGNGVIPNYGFESAPWARDDIRDNVRYVVVNSGVTAVGNRAFQNLDHMTGISLPDTVKVIGEWALYNCPALTSVALPNGLAKISYAMFYQCSSLASVTIPDTVASIDPYAFYECSALSAIELPESVAETGYFVFQGCLNLQSLTIRNANCNIKDSGGDTMGYPNITVIYARSGSTAEQYASKYGYQFVSTGPAPATPTPVPTPEPTPVPTAEPTATPKPTATPVPKLAAPKVTISKVSTGIKVSWNKVTGSPRYMVYYKEGNGGWKKIGTTTSTTYMRAAKYLKNNVTYTFTVRCCANDKKTLLGPYKASNALKYTSQLAAPTVKIAKVSSGIKVTWNKVTGAPRYMVYYKEGNSGWKKIGTTTSTTYTRAAKYLKNNVKYTFTVRCCANDKKTLLSNYKASNSITYKK